MKKLARSEHHHHNTDKRPNTTTTTTTTTTTIMPPKLVTFLLTLLLLHPSHAWKACRKPRKWPDQRGRQRLAGAANSDASKVWLFGGVFNNGTTTDAITEMDPQLGKYGRVVRHYSAGALPSPGIAGSLNPTSVLRLHQGAYFLLIPGTTTDAWYLRNSSSTGWRTLTGFPIAGLTHWCAAYSSTLQLVMVTGGRLANGTTSNAYLALNVSSLAVAASHLEWSMSKGGPEYYAHSCCVLAGDIVTIGGLVDKTGKNNKLVQRVSLKYVPQTNSWLKLEVVSVHEGNRDSRYVMWHAYTSCATEQAFLFSSAPVDERQVTKGYIMGGTLNKTGTSNYITRVSYKRKSAQLEVENGKARGATTAYLKKHHRSPVSVMLNGTVYLMGGTNQRGNPSPKYEVVDVQCGGQRQHQALMPTQGAFCMPYYLLLPMASLAALANAALVIGCARQKVMALDAYKQDADVVFPLISGRPMMDECVCLLFAMIRIYLIICDLLLIKKK